MTRDPSVDVETFIEDGFVAVRGAFPPPVAAAVLARLEPAGGSVGTDAWRLEQRLRPRPSPIDIRSPDTPVSWAVANALA